MNETVDINQANQVRPVLEKFGALAERFRCAIVIVRHFNKESTGGRDANSGRARVGKGLGSIDFDGTVRSILQMTRLTDAEGVLMEHAKSNTGPTGNPLRYHLETHPIWDCSYVQWDGLAVDLSPEERVMKHLSTVPTACKDIKTNVIAEYPGMSEPKVQRTLEKLIRDNRATKDNRGRYRLL